MDLRTPPWQWDAAAAVLGLVLVLASGSLLRVSTAHTYRRGSLVLDGARARRERRSRRRRYGSGALTLARVAIGPLDETKHFKLVGTTGTGKSTAIQELLGGALKRGDAAIIADPDGGYLARFHDRDDVILNPFEPRSRRWDPFAEIRESYDVEMLASSLMPGGEDSSGREWRSYARTFFTAVARRCFQEGRCDVAELWRLLLVAPATEIYPMVVGTPAQPFLEADNARMFGSIRSVAGSALAALEHIAAQRGGTKFSVRQWVREGRGVLFLPYRATQIAALHSTIAAWLRLAIFEAMNGPEQDRHLWLIVDELDALGQIEGLKDALARLRKFGGRCVLGFQSVAQVATIYGAGDAQTIIENCGNTLLLRCSSSEHGGTSLFASRLIGEREVVRRQKSRGRDTQGLFASGGVRRSSHVNEQHMTEPAVMASELEQLPDLSGYLKTASSPAWLRVSLKR
jgi:type IV secretory pathway TraG/TraD family ATPase VirD4